MFLNSLTINNFRALEDISATFRTPISVIVGPNAIGKTTALEAIRFAKALLAPRTQNESNQALFSLGGATPFDPKRLIAEALATDPSKPIRISCQLQLSTEEIEKLEHAVPRMATDLLFSEMGLRFSNLAERVATLSRPDIQNQVSLLASGIKTVLANVKNGLHQCKLDLTLDPTTGSISSGDRFTPMFVVLLEQSLPPSKTLFSYFPADRAIPFQEQPVQIGIADANLQVESHLSQPQLKYQRLKNTIFNAVISGSVESTILKDTFAKVFSRVLKGRAISSIGVDPYGQLRIGVQESEGGRVFSLDAMSSGEKGLILTCLLMALTLAERGVVLMDEPELHLNPAVCKDVLSFIADEYSAKRGLQIILCSHSPEILSSAFEREDCTLFHLRSGKMLTPIRLQDHTEVEDALRRLGTSESEGLLYKATVFVEGEHDADILEAGFGKLFRRYKLSDLGGRGKVEKEIKSLQAAEAKGALLSPKYFIFDKDEKPTDLAGSALVKILQWNRRCLENYLLDIDVLTDLLKDSHLVERPQQNIGEVAQLLKRLAMSQLDDVVMRKIYERYEFSNPGLRTTDIEGKNFQAGAAALFHRLAALRDSIQGIAETEWSSDFVAMCAVEKQKLESTWDARWREICDGKRLFRDLQRDLGIRQSIIAFKKLVIVGMRDTNSEDWRAVESLVKSLLAEQG